MTDPADLHVNNLREALKQYDSFLKPAIFAALTVAVITFSHPSADAAPQCTTLFLGSLPLSYGTLALLAMAGQFAFAALAAGSLDAVSRALRRLQSDQTLLAAACGYPSLATSPSNAIQRGSILLAPGFLLISFVPELLRSGFGGVISIAFGFLVLVSPYIAMWLTVRRLPDVDHAQSTQ